MEFHPPNGTAADEVAAALGGSLVLRVGPQRGRERSYYDTFDGRLRAAGLILAHGDGALALRDAATDAVRARQRMPAPRRALLVSGIPAGELHDVLDGLVDVRALLPLARVRCRERALDVLDDEGKTVARMQLSAPVVGETALPTRLSVSGLRGYEDELAEVCRVLTEQLLFVPARESMVDEAVLALGGRPGGVSSKAQVALAREQTAASAVVAVLRAQLAIIQANLPGALDGVDTEFLHDLRVAVRRSRAVQRECRDVFEPGGLAHFRSEFRWLQQATGDARDMDVYLLGFGDMQAMVAPGLRDDLEPLHEVLLARHRRATAAMRRALRSARAAELLESWPRFLSALEAGDAGPAALMPIGDVAGRRIRTVYRRMVAMGQAIDSDSPPEDYHELRKKGKELRYLLELFGAPLWPPGVVKPLIKSLKGLQDVLGRHQDREVQAATLLALGDAIAASRNGARGLVAVGALVQRLAQDEEAARVQFSERFAPFAAPAQRTQVKETFR